MEQLVITRRMPRNLWRSWDRLNFPLPGLVLYLPFGHPELSGSPIISKDLDAHSFVVSGTTHGLLGRTFDGDDKIKKAIANFRSGDSQGTIVAWHKGTGSGDLFSSADEATSGYFFEFQLNSGYLRVLQRNNDATDTLLASSTLTNDNAWHCSFLCSSGTAWSMFVDEGAAEAMTIQVGSNTGDWFADTGNRDNIIVGALNRDGGEEGLLTAIVGELHIYDHLFTLPERRQVRNATKWRYQS